MPPLTRMRGTLISLAFITATCTYGEAASYFSEALSEFPSRHELSLLRKSLEYYTVFSPEWRVTEERGAKVTEPRNVRGFWTRMVPASAPPETEVRVRIRFSSYLFGNPPQVIQQHMSLREADDGKLNRAEIKVWKEERVFRSVFVLAAGDLWFEVEESSDQVARVGTDLTFRALSALCRESQKLGDLASLRARFAHRGESEKQEVVITPLTARGRYQVSGYVNPQGEGCVVVRVFRRNGDELSAAKARRTLEYVGWSSDVRQQFYFESVLTIDGQGPDESVRIEICFQPRYERRLFGTDALVSKWTR